MIYFLPTVIKVYFCLLWGHGNRNIILQCLFPIAVLTLFFAYISLGLWIFTSFSRISKMQRAKGFHCGRYFNTVAGSTGRCPSNLHCFRLCCFSHRLHTLYFFATRFYFILAAMTFYASFGFAYGYLFWLIYGYIRPILRIPLIRRFEYHLFRAEGRG